MNNYFLFTTIEIKMSSQNITDSCACYNCFFKNADNVVSLNTQNQRYYYTINHNYYTVINECGCNTCNMMYIHYAIDLSLKKMKDYHISIHWGYKEYDRNNKIVKIPFDYINKMKREVNNILTKLGYKNIKITKCPCSDRECYTYDITFEPIRMSVDEANV